MTSLSTTVTILDAQLPLYEIAFDKEELLVSGGTVSPGNCIRLHLEGHKPAKVTLLVVVDVGPKLIAVGIDVKRAKRLS